MCININMCVCVYMNLSVTAILVTMICQYACMHAYTDTHACTRTNAHTYTLTFIPTEQTAQ